MSYGLNGAQEVKYFGDQDLEEPGEERPGVLVYMPKALAERLAELARIETTHLAARAKAEGKKAKVVSRNALIVRILKNAVEDYDAGNEPTSPGVKKPKR